MHNLVKTLNQGVFVKRLVILIGFCLSLNAFAEGSLVRALQAEGFSDADINVITRINQQQGSSCRAKIIFDRDTGISEMKNGVVKFYNEAKREGVITTSDGQRYLFKSGFDIRIGDTVEFKEVINEGNKGLHAVNVRRI